MNDVQELVVALFTVSKGLEHARRGLVDASSLAVLQIISAQKRVRPSEIASQLGVHQSSITRQVRALEEAGHVDVMVDPQDRRSCFITLTDSGVEEIQRLTRIGLERFAAFVEDWDVEEVRTLTRLLIKLEQSKAEVNKREQRTSGRRWQQKK